MRRPALYLFLQIEQIFTSAGLIFAIDELMRVCYIRVELIDGIFHL